jgi:transcriptional regulator with XRE-family HTH domain
MSMKTPGEILREARRRHGLSQARLAVRAGTTQSAISRIERDQVSPTVETLRVLLHLLGEDLRLGTELRDFGIDSSQVLARKRAAPTERLDYAGDMADFVARYRGKARTAKVPA